jgi:hypothetical protein
MVISYSKLIKKYPPGTQSARVHDIIKASDGKLSPEGALDFLTYTQSYYRAELDVASTKLNLVQKLPVVIHDVSHHFYTLLQLLGESVGLETKEAIAVVNVLKDMIVDFGPSHEFLPEKISPLEFRSTFFKNNILQVTNLDPNLVGDPRYIPLVVLGTINYMFYKYRVVGAVDPEAFLSHYGTQVMIQTTNPTIAAAAEIYPHSKYEVLTNGSQLLYSICYSYDQIQKFKKEFPEVNTASADDVAQGFWFFRKLSGHPMKF